MPNISKITVETDDGQTFVWTQFEPVEDLQPLHNNLGFMLTPAGVAASAQPPDPTECLPKT